MIDYRPQAVAYLSAPPEGFWRWADRGEVVAWHDGSTVAFRAELETVLAALAPRGLPQFNALVLLLAACRGKVPEASGLGAPILGGQDAVRPPERADATGALAALAGVARLPADLTGNPEGKGLLADAVFGEADRVLRGGAVEAVMRALREGLVEAELNAPNYFHPPNFQWWHVDMVRRGLAGQSVETLRLRRSTGLEEVPEPAEIPLKPAARVRRLIQELQNDPEHSGMARAVRDIMAALYLPRPLSETDEIALGGFSDISNRGAIDRLLVSELAHDDLTLAVRIALNEALYLRREPPASRPPTGFAILLDSGVRMWGVPRVFAASVALALIAREDRQEAVSAYRARRDTLVETDLCTRAGLVQHLGQLETPAHPGAAMKLLFERLDPEAGVEVVVITHPDAVADDDFKRALAAVAKPFYLATVDRDGCFELYARPGGATPLCQARIDLNGLFPGRPAAKATLIDLKLDPKLPRILSLHPLPFLLPVLGKVDKTVRTPEGGGVCALNDRRLMAWRGPGEGATTMTSQLPKGRTLWLERDVAGTVRLVKHRAGTASASLCEIGPDSPAVRVVEFPAPPQVVWQWAEGQTLFLVSAIGIQALDLATGRDLGTLEHVADVIPRMLRYYPSREGPWKFFTFDGTRPVWRTVSLPEGMRSAQLMTLFDRPGFEGPWGLTFDGRVLTHLGEVSINLGRNMVTVRISDDGERVLVNGVGGREFQLIDLRRRTCPPVAATHAESVLNPPIPVPMRNLRVNFEAISLGDGDHEIRLCSAKGKWWRLATNPEPQFLPVPAPPTASRWRQFRHVELPRDIGYTLKAAHWDDGTAAYLDSRGMLHLKHGDPVIPEVSLVLTDGPTPVWSADGFVHGAPFFLGTQRPANAAVIAEKIAAYGRVSP
jgi:hypothetical protein